MFILPQIEGEVSERREDMRRTHAGTPAVRQRSPSPHRVSESRVQKPLRSPIASLPSNTADVLRSRGDYTAARRSEEYLRSRSPARYESIIPSLPSNTEDELAARGRDTTRSAADLKSTAELARFCDGLLLNSRR